MVYQILEAGMVDSDKLVQALSDELYRKEIRRSALLAFGLFPSVFLEEARRIIEGMLGRVIVEVSPP